MNIYFNKNIKYLRKQNSISQIELGNQLSVGRTAIAGYEIGKSKPTFDTLTQIAAYFGVNIDDLIYKDLEQTTVRTKPYLQSQITQVEESKASYQITKKKNQNIFVPTKAQKHYLSDYNQEIPKDCESINIPNIPYNARTFEVSDNSLSPYLIQGDLVVSKKLEAIQDFNRNKLYIVVSLTKGISINFIEIIDNQAILRSTNEALYKTITLPLTDIKEVWECTMKVSNSILSAANQQQEQFKNLQQNLEDLQERIKMMEED
jgi:transcriptional regulator with XRE-family HTH domain